jgi:hypothetical protein
MLTGSSCERPPTTGSTTHRKDVNLGVVLTIWDVLAGCARFPSRTGGVDRTGLDGRPVPVGQEAAAGPALVLLAGELAESFRARA